MPSSTSVRMTDATYRHGYESVEIAVLMPSPGCTSGRQAPYAPANAVAPRSAPGFLPTRAQVCFGGTVEPTPFQGERALLLLPRKTQQHEHRKTCRSDESCHGPASKPTRVVERAARYGPHCRRRRIPASHVSSLFGRVPAKRNAPPEITNALHQSDSKRGEAITMGA